MGNCPNTNYGFGSAAGSAEGLGASGVGSATGESPAGFGGSAAGVASAAGFAGSTAGAASAGLEAGGRLEAAGEDSVVAGVTAGAGVVGVGVAGAGVVGAGVVGAGVVGAGVASAAAGLVSVSGVVAGARSGVNDSKPPIPPIPDSAFESAVMFRLSGRYQKQVRAQRTIQSRTATAVILVKISPALTPNALAPPAPPNAPVNPPPRPRWSRIMRTMKSERRNNAGPKTY